MSEIWFTSDLHFGHKNIIKFMDNREFSNIEEHDEALIENLNSCVGPKDDVYFLGDMAMSKNVDHIIPRLPGKWHIIRGNHDYWCKKTGQVERVLDTYKNIVEITDYKELKVSKVRYVLFHYPIETFNRRSIQLHGHTHSLSIVSGPNRIHVGVDAWELHPMHIDNIEQYSVDYSLNKDN